MGVVSGIQLQLIGNPQGGVAKKNVVYLIKYPDGSVWRTTRVWNGFLSMRNRASLANKTVTEQPPTIYLPILKKYIDFCEKNPGNKFSGACILKTCIQPAPPKPPTITEQLKNSVKVQRAEIADLRQQVVALQAQIQQERIDTARNSEIIARLQGEIERLSALFDGI